MRFLVAVFLVGHAVGRGDRVRARRPGPPRLRMRRRHQARTAAVRLEAWCGRAGGGIRGARLLVDLPVQAGGLSPVRLPAALRHPICTANVPTPPEAPLIKTRWPACTFRASRSPWRAAGAAVGTAAACSNERFAGFAANAFSVADAYSASVPLQAPNTS